MLFVSFFRSLPGKRISVELNEGIILEGILDSVDPFLNFGLSDLKVIKSEGRSYLHSLDTIFIRGNRVRYVSILDDKNIDVPLLVEASRRASKTIKIIVSETKREEIIDKHKQEVKKQDITDEVEREVEKALAEIE
ncbi:U6 snRNA-associated Sm-like protein LSm2 like protein [Aduncisulcus paluster]|uniref:U6 snRNA-associated Sm-like protein LSm2 like protein n=1 Tax=Aduncisulcus paluster TaxID=2918883 RepID=A0ABQ5KQS0_9EUKA|nr:U6 snRNA-associated Sm-like protein LSm2 like protein [Aduncisulcus paluster]